MITTKVVLDGETYTLNEKGSVLCKSKRDAFNGKLCACGCGERFVPSSATPNQKFKYRIHYMDYREKMRSQA